MILYFQNSRGECEIGKPNTYKETNAIIDTFLEECKFKSYYSRVWKENDTPFTKADKCKNRYVIDVGSHTEFFILDTCGENIEELAGL